MTNNEFFEKYSYSYNEPNSISYYNGFDNSELYKKNLIKNKNLLEKNNWIDTQIIYSHNNYGFRTPDNFDIINPKDGNMFLGCSVTEGIGLHLEDTWAYKINKKLGGCFYNLSQSGTGIETIYRLLKTWYPIIKPKNVFIMALHKNRKEFINKKKFNYDVFGPWLFDKKNKTSDKKIKEIFYEYFLISEDETTIFWERNWDAIKSVAKEYNINLYKVNEEKCYDAKTESTNKDSWARDCAHYGTLFHNMISDFDNWEKIK